MAPAFRLTTRPLVSENMSQFTVDFSTERAGLQHLHFLPGPRTRPRLFFNLLWFVFSFCFPPVCFFHSVLLNKQLESGFHDDRHVFSS